MNSFAAGLGMVAWIFAAFSLSPDIKELNARVKKLEEAAKA